MNNKQTEAFFALLRAGLWEKEVRLSAYQPIDFTAIQTMAEEQSVVGLITAGLEHVSDVTVSKIDLLQFIGQTLLIEEQNKMMNAFIGDLVEKLYDSGIYAILVKGQGIAQCYERPLWRACGDVDLFLSNDNYEKAKQYLLPLCSAHDDELVEEKHFGLTIDSWIVELHGSLPSRISKRADKELEKIQDYVFYRGNASSWRVGRTTVPILNPNENIIYVFTHILKHFFYSGIGLRQVCDWCRLLWMNRNFIDRTLLLRRVEKMGFLSEWKVFASIAVDYLGMPKDAMPLYLSSKKLMKKSEQVLENMLQVGNFGHKKDESFRIKSPFLYRKWIVFTRRLKELSHHIRVFPLDSLRVFNYVFISGIKSTLKHEG